VLVGAVPFVGVGDCTAVGVATGATAGVFPDFFELLFVDARFGVVVVAAAVFEPDLRVPFFLVDLLLAGGDDSALADLLDLPLFMFHKTLQNGDMTNR
jgi:hypothetical protein